MLRNVSVHNEPARSCTIWLLVCGLLTLSGSVLHAAPEPWADPNLKILRGLAVWLVASAQSAARKHAGREEPRDGDPLDAWSDGSGNGRTLHARDALSRPKVRIDGAQAFVCFDGAASC